MIKIFICATISMMAICQQARAECFGSGDYRVCSESYTDSLGNVKIRSCEHHLNASRCDGVVFDQQNAHISLRWLCRI